MRDREWTGAPGAVERRSEYVVAVVMSMELISCFGKPG
jgi:hypothetical protein